MNKWLSCGIGFHSYAVPTCSIASRPALYSTLLYLLCLTFSSNKWVGANQPTYCWHQQVSSHSARKHATCCMPRVVLSLLPTYAYAASPFPLLTSSCPDYWTSEPETPIVSELKHSMYAEKLENINGPFTEVVLHSCKCICGAPCSVIYATAYQSICMCCTVMMNVHYSYTYPTDNWS